MGHYKFRDPWNTCLAVSTFSGVMKCISLNFMTRENPCSWFCKPFMVYINNQLRISWKFHDHEIWWPWKVSSCVFQHIFMGLLWKRDSYWCDKKDKKINLEITSFRLSYSGDCLHGSFSWDVLEKSLLIIVLWGLYR